MAQVEFSELLTEAQTAERLGVSSATLARWRTTNQGPAWHDFGRRGILYLPDEVRKCAENRGLRASPGPSPDGTARVAPIGFDSRKGRNDCPFSGRRVVVDLPWPPSVNGLYVDVNGRRILSARGREYKKRAARIVRGAVASPLSGSVAVALDCYPPDSRRRDLDNVFKAVFDSLTNGGLWNDDSQVRSIRAEMHGPDGRGRVVLTAGPRAVAQESEVADHDGR